MYVGTGVYIMEKEARLEGASTGYSHNVLLNST